MKKIVSYFSVFEWALWIGSVIVILLSFFLFRTDNVWMPITSLIGVTSLIFCAKGNPIGEFLMLFFSLLYGVISYSYHYYGEMITYLGMTAPMSLFSMISWLKNPYQGNASEVNVNCIKRKELFLIIPLTTIVTILFYFILAGFHTANLLPSTISVTTSFLAVYLTFRRSPFYAIAYAANDIILSILWGLASIEDSNYLSVVICFVIFLVNDLYGYSNWKKMYTRQQENKDYVKEQLG